MARVGQPSWRWMYVIVCLNLRHILAGGGDLMDTFGITLPTVNQSHYDALGLRADATPQEVRKAYHRLSLTEHPDKGGNVERFNRIKQAKNEIDGGFAYQEQRARAENTVYAPPPLTSQHSQPRQQYQQPSPRAREPRQAPPAPAPRSPVSRQTSSDRTASWLNNSMSNMHLDPEGREATGQRAISPPRDVTPLRDRRHDSTNIMQNQDVWGFSESESEHALPQRTKPVKSPFEEQTRQAPNLERSSTRSRRSEASSRAGRESSIRPKVSFADEQPRKRDSREIRGSQSLTKPPTSPKYDVPKEENRRSSAEYPRRSDSTTDGGGEGRSSQRPPAERVSSRRDEPRYRQSKRTSERPPDSSDRSSAERARDRPPRPRASDSSRDTQGGRRTHRGPPSQDFAPRDKPTQSGSSSEKRSQEQRSSHEASSTPRSGRPTHRRQDSSSNLLNKAADSRVPLERYDKRTSSMPHSELKATDNLRDVFRKTADEVAREKKAGLSGTKSRGGLPRSPSRAAKPPESPVDSDAQSSHGRGGQRFDFPTKTVHRSPSSNLKDYKEQDAAKSGRSKKPPQQVRREKKTETEKNTGLGMGYESDTPLHTHARPTAPKEFSAESRGRDRPSSSRRPDSRPSPSDRSERLGKVSMKNYSPSPLHSRESTQSALRSTIPASSESSLSGDSGSSLSHRTGSGSMAGHSSGGETPERRPPPSPRPPPGGPQMTLPRVKSRPDVRPGPSSSPTSARSPFSQGTTSRSPSPSPPPNTPPKSSDAFLQAHRSTARMGHPERQPSLERQQSIHQTLPANFAPPRAAESKYTPSMMESYHFDRSSHGGSQHGGHALDPAGPSRSQSGGGWSDMSFGHVSRTSSVATPVPITRPESSGSLHGQPSPARSMPGRGRETGQASPTSGSLPAGRGAVARTDPGWAHSAFPTREQLQEATRLQQEHYKVEGPHVQHIPGRTSTSSAAGSPGTPPLAAKKESKGFFKKMVSGLKPKKGGKL